LIGEGIKKLVDGTNLSFEEAQGIFHEIISGEATSAQIAAFLTALRMKGETVEEIAAFAQVMRENCLRIKPNVNGRLLDTCGTGGDKLKTFNVSTTAAFVIVGAGVAVAKHGNRSVTSRSGSADVLEQLGVNLAVGPEIVEKAIEQTGIGFMFAPIFHPAMKNAVAPRREIGIRTVFNLLGPLTNPANANVQLLGVYDLKLTERLAYVLKELGCKEAMVVHGIDGLDEISTLGKTAISRLKDGKVTTMKISPKDLKVKQVSVQDLEGGTSEENAEMTFRLLSNVYSNGEARTDIVLANAAAGLIVSGKAQNFSEGIELARESIRSGSAYAKLKDLVRKTCGTGSKLEELENKFA
jgi:anthranilate phosphoribosyltransferase